MDFEIDKVFFSGTGELLRVCVVKNKGKYQLAKNHLEGERIKLIELGKLDGSDGAKLCRAVGKMFSFMPDYSNIKISLPKIFLKKEISESVVFFGGSFNPWHEGHMACLDACGEKNIVVAPDYNPRKKMTNDSCVWKKYLELVLLLEKTKHSVYPGFLSMSKPNPTSQWLPRVTISSKGLLLGDDSFYSLTTWIKAEKLIAAINVIYVTPRGYSEKELEQKCEEITVINPQIKVLFLNNHQYELMSSSKLRYTDRLLLKK